MPLPAGTIAFDFDADGKADFARWRKSDGGWSVKKSSDNSTVSYTLGSGSSTIVPADYDNDGKTDYAVFNESTGGWTIRKSSTGTDQTLSSFGQSGDKAVVGDFDGDSKADPAVWRPSNGTWYVAQSSSSYTVVSTQFGQSGDIPVAGDYDGDGALDKAVYRPNGGYWYVLGTTSGFTATQWGLSSDIPVPADYDGDNKTDYSVYRGSTGTWYAYKSSGTGQYISQTWGNYGDQPVPADYDGDGVADFAVWRPTSGNWYVFKSCNYYGTACSSGNNYQYAQLGANGDSPAPAAYLKQTGSFIQSYDMARTRLSPKNETGGTNLYSRNFSWGTSLVSLPGRAGLNAGFGMSYNSLVWTKHGSSVYFDIDNSNISPGFRFGFPVIEPVYYDDNGTRTFNYMMVTPEGRRVEFRQTSGASDTYEAADSSYLQLKTMGASNPNDPAENITISVTETDGTKMSYEWKAGAFRCNQIKDRNGNYITINHDEYGLLRTVTDTLGRIITVNYDSQFYPTSITQTWKDGNGQGSNITHTWATFTYSTSEPSISTNFNSTYITNVFGPPNGTSLKVLKKVTFPTESNSAGPHTVFTYNSWGQVSQITNYSADDTELNYIRVNLPANANNPESDCPRFTETYSKAANFNNNQEVLIKNTYTEGVTYTLPDSSQVTGTMIEVKSPNADGAADKLVSKIYTSSSGWAEALPVLAEDWADEGAGLSKKRWAWMNWTQDNTSLSYILNPRVTEAKIGDETNTKRTKMYYLMQSGSSTVTQYGLPNKVEVYAQDQSTVLKTQTINYNLDSNYTSRRIIGLRAANALYEGTDSSGTLMSKVTYIYDENGYSGTGQSVSATQHDNSSYGTGFSYRGNQTSMTRWDVSNSTNSALAVTSQNKYNIAGSLISKTDPLSHTISLSYSDSWNDAVSRSTYAYPTTITDAGGYSSTVKYRYDTGANVWARSPAPSGTGNQYGKTTSRTYEDLAGRIVKEKVDNSLSGAYTRYAYPANGASLLTYSTISDTGNDGVDSSDEVLTETLFDGAGRVRKSRTENPGSTGGYTGSIVEYNVLGQLKRETVPTEINSSWNPAGDDYRGMNGSNYVWLWNSLEYDWKGRVTKEINTDGTDRLYSYNGCGCAGGQVITIKGEVTTAVDVSNTTQTTKRRTQKIYEDILGRTIKTELWDLDGGGTAPFSTTVNTYNGRDQITQTRQYAGGSGSSSFQDTTFAYDGHGRLSARHRPEQRDSNNAATYTTYSYNEDDTLESITDARGAVTNYAYNNRQLVDSISYSVPQNSTIPLPATVSFEYDAAGNRTEMEDGLGVVNYVYNELSQLVSETRDFNDTLTNAPTTNNGNYKITYNYTPTGQLKSLKNPFDFQSNYSFDKVGRLTTVGGNGYGDLPSTQPVVSDMQYRAFETLKQASYANGTQATMEYNNRLQPSSYRLIKTSNSQILFGKDYYYTTGTNNDNDGLLKRSVHYDDTQTSTERGKKNRTNTYDFLGRIKTSDAGEYGTTPFGSNMTNGAFQQVYWYNDFGKLKEIVDRDFETNVIGCVGCPRMTFYKETIGNNNRTTESYFGEGNYGGGITNYQYDQDGRLTTRGSETYQYNAAGQRISADMTGTTPDPSYQYDGDGKLIKLSENGSVKSYDIISSVLNVTVSELSSTGAMDKSYILSTNGARIAEMKNDEVQFVYNEPSGAEKYTFKMNQTNLLKATYDPVDRTTSNPGYTGGGPCGNNCPGGYNPPGGFDGLSQLTAMIISERMRSQQFWTQTQTGWQQKGYHWGQAVTRNSDLNDRTIGYEWGARDGNSTLHYLGAHVPAYAFVMVPQEQSNLPPSPPNWAPNYQELYNAIYDCAFSMFGVHLTRVYWSDKGVSGEMQFAPAEGTEIKVWNRGRGKIYTYVQKSFSIYNDTVTYALGAKELDGGLAIATTYEGNGSPGIYYATWRNGITEWTNRTYTANNRETSTSQIESTIASGLGFNGYVTSQIHEVGNALSQITGKNPEPAKPWNGRDLGSEDSDNGQAFEACVFLNYRKRIGIDK
jgi:YD repeat-containing protein